MSEVVSIVGEAAFEAHVIRNPKPALVDFYAEWCGPCKSLSTVVEALAGEYRERLDVFKLDVDRTPELSNRLGIRAVPTLILFRDGHPVETIVGAVSRGVLERTIQSHTAERT